MKNDTKAARRRRVKVYAKLKDKRERSGDPTPITPHEIEVELLKPPKPPYGTAGLKKVLDQVNRETKDWKPLASLQDPVETPVLQELTQDPVKAEAVETPLLTELPPRDTPAPLPAIDFMALDDETLWALEELDMMLRVRQEQGIASVMAFARLVFGLVLPDHAQKWVEEILENKRVAIAAPPESAKTTVGIIVVAWWMGKYPWRTNMIVSVGDDLAGDIAQKVADTIEFNPKWKLVFPNVVPNKSAGWSRDGYEVMDTAMEPDLWRRRTAAKKDPSLMFGGVGSSNINGRRVSGILWVDDIHDRKSKSSATVCKDTVDFLKDTVISRAKEKAHLVVVQSPWSPKDSIAYVNSIPTFKVFIHPALVDGVSYWPAIWPVERLERRRAEITEIEWQLTYLCNAEAASGQLLKAESLRNFPHAAIRREWQCYFGVDFAQKLQELSAKDEAKHSHFAIAIMVFTGNMLVLEDGYDALISMGEAEDIFFSMAEHRRPVRCGIEVNGHSLAYYNNLVRRKIVKGLGWLNLGKIVTTLDKGTRMAEMEPDFRDGTIQVSDSELPFLRIFRDQWVGFGTHPLTDALDAVYNARMVASHLLPQESPDAARDRKRIRPRMTPARMIDKVFGV